MQSGSQTVQGTASNGSDINQNMAQTADQTNHYSSMRQYVMPWSDLSRFANDSTRRLNVIYVDETCLE